MTTPHPAPTHTQQKKKRTVQILATLCTDLPQPKTMSYCFQQGVAEAQERLGWLNEHMLLPNCVFHIRPYDDLVREGAYEPRVEVQTGPIVPTVGDLEQPVTEEVAYHMALISQEHMLGQRPEDEWLYDPALRIEPLTGESVVFEGEEEEGGEEEVDEFGNPMTGEPKSAFPPHDEDDDEGNLFAHPF